MGVAVGVDTNDGVDNGVSVDVGLLGLPSEVRVGIIPGEIKVIDGRLDVSGNGVPEFAEPQQLSDPSGDYRLRVPVTVHIGIGSDIIHEHPNCDGAALGAASYRDFLIITQAITEMQSGVVLSVGTQVMGPEVFLKGLAMARNVAHFDAPPERVWEIVEQVLLEADGVHDVPAVEAEPLLALVQAVGLDDLVQAQVRGGEGGVALAGDVEVPGVEELHDDHAEDVVIGDVRRRIHQRQAAEQLAERRRAAGGRSAASHTRAPARRGGVGGRSRAQARR